MSALNQAYDDLSDKIKEYGNARYFEGISLAAAAAADAETLWSEVAAKIEALVKAANAQ